MATKTLTYKQLLRKRLAKYKKEEAYYKSAIKRTNKLLRKKR